MKKLFCILSLAFGALSIVFGLVCIALTVMDLHKKVKCEKQAALEKVRAYIAKKMDIVEVTPEEVIES